MAKRSKKTSKRASLQRKPAGGAKRFSRQRADKNNVTGPFRLQGVEDQGAGQTLTAGRRWRHIRVNVKATFRPGTARAAESVTSIEVGESDIIEIEFQQGVRLWVSAADYRERISGTSPRATGPLSAFAVPSSIPLGLPGTRGLGSWIVKSMSVLGLDLAGKAASSIAALAEDPGSEHRPWLGLSRCTLETGKFALSKLSRDATDRSGPCLLFIHGTFSSTWGSFGDLWSEERAAELSRLKALYGQRVFAFDHRTLTRSPFENAIELIQLLNNNLPEESEIHIVTHSRGGLVSELLCWDGKDLRLEKNSSGTSDDFEQLQESIPALQRALRQKRFKVTRVVRVACPARGTTLVSGRLDRWLSVLGSVLSSALPGTPLADTFEDIGEFIAAVIKERSEPHTLPGIQAMMPESALIAALNRHGVTVSGDLTVVAGDVEPDKWWTRLLVWATDQFYESDHDLVVNTPSMYGGALRSGKALVSFHQGADVNHFNYFRNQDSAASVVDALALQAGAAGNFEVLVPTQVEIARGEEFASPGDIPKPMAYTRTKRSETQPHVSVRVIHGDLAFSAYPVMVGHYAGDTIISAEKYLDRELGHSLIQRHHLGLYPGAIETSAIFVNPLAREGEYRALGGAIVVGLGPVGQLSAASLSRSVARALKEYVLQWPTSHADARDNLTGKNTRDYSVTSVLIGTNAGGVNVPEAVRAILLGVAGANTSLRSVRNAANLVPRIGSIEFVEYWEDRAIEAVRSFTQLQDDPDINTAFTFTPTLVVRKGGMRRLSSKEPAGWWQRLQILGQSGGDSGEYLLRFSPLTRRARTEVRLHSSQRPLIENFIQSVILSTSDDSEIAQTLFELLLPNELKDQAPDQDDLLLMVDEQAASYPWELLRDPAEKGAPMAVQKGLLRQLDTIDSPSIVRESGGSAALVIGDPITEFVPLPGAEEEATAVWRLLQRGDFEPVERLIHSRAPEVLNALYARPYRVLHLAGHGVFEATSGSRKGRTGMVLSDGVVLSPIEVHQMRNVPELVFINCCHLGRIEGSQTEARKSNSRNDLNKFAANVAVEFIRAGVRAVIAAGWAVDDGAATVFALAFYKAMLDGVAFGESVRRARQAAYDKYPASNTWGAYQCYGDPDYCLRKKEMATEHPGRLAFVTPHEAAVEIQNVASALSLAARDETEQFRKTLEQIEQAIEQREPKSGKGNSGGKWTGNGRILAGLARAYGELGEFVRAIDYYERAEAAEDGNLKLVDIEQWANLEIRYAASVAREKGTRNSQAMTEFSRLAGRGIDRLKSLKPTAERLRLLGSAYKRIALVSPADRSNALKEMTEQYSAAYTLEQKAGRFDPYAFLNIRAGEIATVIHEGQNVTRRMGQIHEHLVERAAEFQADIEGKEDFWGIVKVIDFKLLLAITTRPSDFLELNSLAREYKDAKRFASRREFASVMDQVVFLQTIASGRDRDLASALKRLQEEISR